jgi:aminoglycoside 6'-N-acetyltransferase I
VDNPSTSARPKAGSVRVTRYASLGWKPLNTAFAAVSAKDVEAFAELYASVYNAAPWHDEWTVAGAKERLRGLAAAPRFEALGAYQAGNGVGLVLGSGVRLANGWVLHIREMFVGPNLQRSGIGRDLLAAFERSLAGSYIGVYLQTGGHLPADKFYAGCGYAIADMVSMTKRIEAQPRRRADVSDAAARRRARRSLER